MTGKIIPLSKTFLENSLRQNLEEKFLKLSRREKP